MALIRQLVDRIMQYIENGNFFRNPMKIIYIINGVLSFLPALLPIVALVTMGKYFMESWSNIISCLVLLLVLVYFVFLGFFGYYYWRNRRKNLDTIARSGNKIKATPVWAHFVKCNGEWLGLYLFIAPLGAYIIGFVLLTFSGFTFMGGAMGGEGVGGFLVAFFLGLLSIPILALVLFMICYPIIYLAHLLSERLLIRAMVANDVSDIGDIHRAAVMVSEVKKTETTFEQAIETEGKEK